MKCFVFAGAKRRQKQTVFRRQNKLPDLPQKEDRGLLKSSVGEKGSWWMDGGRGRTVVEVMSGAGCATIKVRESWLR